MRAVAALTQADVLPRFMQDEDEQADKIQQVTAELTALFKQCERRMSELKATMGTGEESDDVVRNGILTASASKLQELHFQFRRLQKTYLKRAGPARRVGPWAAAQAWGANRAQG